MPNRSSLKLLNHLIKQIKKVIYTPYAEPHDTGFKKVLFGASLLYGSAAVFKRKLYQNKKHSIKKLPVPTVSVGNLAVGGTGKTPMTVYLAKLLRNQHYYPAILSRGYGGTFEKKGGIVSDGNSILADSIQAGDEPLMMAKELTGIPVLVGRNRYQSGLRAVKKFGCNIVLLDDGFQHVRLYRDLNIVLLDAELPIGNGYLLPRGILREPYCSLSAAHGVVFTRTPLKRPPIPSKIAKYIKPHTIFWARQKIYPHYYFDGSKTSLPVNPAHLKGKKVYLFSGIARNDDFHHTIKTMGAKIMGHDTYGDHHRFCKEEIRAIIEKAVKTTSELLVTTEKDFARIENSIQWTLPFLAIGVKMTFSNNAFDRFVMRSIGVTC